MKNEGKSNCTIKNYDKLLTFLADHADLSQPEQVKRFMASHRTSNGHKRNLSIAYNYYAKTHGIEWQKPNYRQEPRPIRIPTKDKLEILISNARTNLSVKLQLSMETGLRPVELCNLKTKDMDLQQRIVYPTTAKYGASRSLRISPNLAERARIEKCDAHIDARALDVKFRAVGWAMKLKCRGLQGVLRQR